MSRKIILVLIFLPGMLFSQKKYLRERLIPLRKMHDVYSILCYQKADTASLDLITLDSAKISCLFHAAVEKSIRKKDSIRESRILSAFSIVSRDYFSKRKFRANKWFQAQRHFGRSLPYMNVKFGILESASFTVKCSKSGGYYYDEKDPRSPYHLFTGSKDLPEKSKPILILSEKEFQEVLMKELGKLDFIRKNQMRSFSYIGFSYYLENKKDEIPRLRFFIFFGGKRLKLVKEKIK